MPGKLIGATVGIFCGLAAPVALVWAGYWIAMDRPAYHVGLCPVCVGWGPGAHVQIAGLKTAFATEQSALNTERDAVNQQNAAIQATHDQAEVWQARSRQAVSDAARANAWRLATAAQIRRETLPADTTAAERCMASETLLRGAAR